MAYWEEWEEKGKDWKTIIEGAEGILRGFIESYNMEVKKYRWEEPSMILSSQIDPKTRCSIHLLVEGEHGDYSLRIRAAAESHSKKYEKEIKLGRPENVVKKASYIEEAVREAYSKII